MTADKREEPNVFSPVKISFRAKLTTKTTATQLFVSEK